MKEPEGFSLIEILISIVLLGLIAAGLIAFAYPRASFYQTNAASLIAEKKLEDCRNNSSFTNLANTNGTETIDGLTYNWTITVAKYDLSTTSPSSGPYTLTTGSNPILNSGSKQRVALVTVTVQNSSKTMTLATGSTIIVNPAP